MSYDRTLLTDAQVEEFLRNHAGWAREEKALVKTYELPTFRDAIKFVERVAEIAERHDHHPDIDIRYRKVRLLLTTHDAGGLTFRDSLVAGEADDRA